MLVLTRKKDEGIQIGDDVVVRIMEIQGGQVRIGIHAPRDIRIVREEIVQAVREENISSIATEKPDIATIQGLFKKENVPSIHKEDSDAAI
jgi:carbon storage regulator